MSLFLETIKINNGHRINLEGHNMRMNRTRNRHFHEIRDIDLENEVDVPADFKFGIVKCRVIYGRQVEKITFEPYVFKDPRSFKLVNADHIEYGFKDANREPLNLLFASKGKVDDIIMTKQGYITDSFYANLAFLKNEIWYTPRKPLLEGTFRAKMLMNEKLVPLDIHTNDLPNFEKIKIINAMTEWGMHEAVDVLIGEHIFLEGS